MASVFVISLLVLVIAVSIELGVYYYIWPAFTLKPETSIVTTPSPTFCEVSSQHLISFDGYNSSDFKFPLPSPPEPFIGRADIKLKVFKDLSLSRKRIVGLFGPPAFGKSSLAIHTGHRLLKELPVNYIDVSEYGLSFQQQFPSNGDTNRGSDVEVYIKRSSLSATVSESTVKKALIGAHLTEWAKYISVPTILILDNCDSLVHRSQDEFQRFILNLLRVSSQNLRILMTSQVKVSFLDHFSSYFVSELEPNDSYSLITNLSESVVVPKHTQIKLAELVGNCPLAIKVLVMLLRQPQALSPMEFMKQVERDTLGVLSNRNLPQENRFTEVMNIAYKYLSTELKELAYQLSLFPGSFHEEAVFNITSHSLKLQELVDRSLLERYKQHFVVRYKLHRLIRKYFRGIELAARFKLNEAFEEKFIQYYSVLLSNSILNYLYDSDNTGSKGLLQLEQHNMEHLLHRIMAIYLSDPGTTSLLWPAQGAIVLFAYRENILPTDFPAHLIQYIYERGELLDGACALIGHDMCISVFEDFADSQIGERTVIDQGFVDSCGFVTKLESEIAKKKTNHSHLLHKAVNRSRCYCSKKEQVLRAGKPAHVIMSIGFMFVFVFWYLNKKRSSCSDKINTSLLGGLVLYSGKTVLNYDKVWNGLLLPVIRFSPHHLLTHEIIVFNLISFMFVFFCSSRSSQIQSILYLVSIVVSGMFGLYITLCMESWVVTNRLDLAILITSFASNTATICLSCNLFSLRDSRPQINSNYFNYKLDIFVLFVFCYCKLFQTISLFGFVNACTKVTKFFCNTIDWFNPGSNLFIIIEYIHLQQHIILLLLIYIPFSLFYNTFPFFMLRKAMTVT